MSRRQLTGAISRPRPKKGSARTTRGSIPRRVGPSALITGPSKEAVIRVHEKAGHPAKERYELWIQTS